MSRGGWAFIGNGQLTWKPRRMFPASWLKGRVLRRRHQAATVVFASAYTYLKVDESTRRRIVSETERFVRSIGWPIAEFRSFADWHVVAQMHALSMARLGVQPMLLAAWPPQLRATAAVGRAALSFFRDFRAIGPAADAALKALGLQAPDIEEILPSTLGDPVSNAMLVPQKGRKPVVLWT